MLDLDQTGVRRPYSLLWNRRLCIEQPSPFSTSSYRVARLRMGQLREDLVGDERTKKTLLDQLPSEEVDERQAFDAFRRFLAAETERRGAHGIDGGPDLVEMVSWTDYDWGDGETTSDPAQWHDWLASVEAARRAT